VKGTSYDLKINRNTNDLSDGTADFQQARVSVGSETSADSMTGLIGEVGIWSSAFTGGQSSSMSANQRAYWGF